MSNLVPISLRWHYPDSGSMGVISAAISAAPQASNQDRRDLPVSQEVLDADLQIAAGTAGARRGDAIGKSKNSDIFP
jgi:hypothetical protein